MLGSGKVNRLMPSMDSEGVSKTLRIDPFGAPHVRSELRAWVEEGSYFRCCNPTFGTGIAQSIQTSFVATNAIAILRNTSATKCIAPHYVRLICTAAGASTTSSHLGVVLDTVNRYASGGSDLTANIVNASTETGLGASVADLRFGALTATAATSPRAVSRVTLKTQAAACWTVGDEVKIVFMGDDGDASLISGSAASRFVANIGPVCLRGSNASMLLHLWNVANATTAPSWETEWAWWER